MSKRKRIYNLICFSILPIIIFILQESIFHNPINDIIKRILFLNIILYVLISFFLFFLTGNAKISIRILTVFAIIIGLADYYVIKFRSIPILPWDIYSVSTATKVVNNYDYSIEIKPLIVVILLIILFICSGKFQLNIKKLSFIRTIGSFVFALLLIIFTKSVQSDTIIKNFQLFNRIYSSESMTYHNGMAIAFLMELKYLKVDIPKNYSSASASNIILNYTEEDTLKKPNIIVVMNEAFSDLSLLGEYSTSRDEIPYIRSLMAGAPNTTSGYLDVSVLGGGTANSEFEFLTGDSMAFLPSGSFPYMQYIHSNTNSLVSYLKSKNYSAIAMHPYDPSGWNRTKVYNYFGFDHFYSLGDFNSPEKIREYVSDKSDVEKIIELYEKRDIRKPFFLFNITMQNHSSYTERYENFAPDITVEGTNSFELNSYLSLLSKSDESLKSLINYFQSQDEPTIVVFFGDHQPANSVVEPIYQINSIDMSTLSYDSTLLRYKVPFIIWTNYDSPEESNMSMSINYLGPKVLEIAGFKSNGYFNYLSDLKNLYPSITSMQIKNAKGKVTSVELQRDILLDYQLLQYYNLFDAKNSFQN